MERYLVTGGAGFIGSHIAGELVRRGEEVRVIDTFLTGKRENLTTFLDKIEFIEGDIRDIKTCQKVTDGVDFVLHQAALPSVPRSIEDPLLASDINIRGTLNLLCAARDEGVKTFVLYCQVFSQIYGLPTVCLRYFNVFGPRQDPFSQYAAVIPNFIEKMLRGEQQIIYGDGEQSRDFSYVSNVVEANLIAAKKAGVSPAVFNIACGERTSVNTLVNKLNEILGTGIVPIHDEPRPGDVKHSLADITKSRKLLEYAPAVSFTQGLEKAVRWFQERRKDG